jgi:hypothetical protein
MPEKLKQIGSLWTHKDKSGGTFLAGTIELEGERKIGVLVFKNKYRDPDKNHPHYKVYLSEPKED